MADAKPKFAMPNGSYPINTCADVSDAAKLAHNSNTYSFAEIKAHVMKAKNALGCSDDVLPDTWKSASQGRPPRDNIVRAIKPAVEIRDSSAGGPPTMYGHFSVFNQWTEVDSIWEGNFMERIAPGAFAKSFQEPARSQVKVTFNHGEDPSLGDKILGPIAELREDKTGAYYEVELFDGIDPLLLNGLRSGAYGASFRFRVTREDKDNSPKTSTYNPNGIPERTIKEIELYEFGPVTFPAYANASAGVRSMTDEFLVERLLRDPRLPDLIAGMRERGALDQRALDALTPVEPAVIETATVAPATPTQPEGTSDRRAAKPVARFKNTEEWHEWINKI